MLLGLMSDTHNNEKRTGQAMQVFREEEPEVILHMGDVTEPRMIPSYFDGWEMWIVQGNIDRNPEGLRAAAEMCDPTIQFGDMFELSFDNVDVGMIHGDDPGRLEGMVNSGGFDLVLHGHTHEFRDEDLGKTRIVNPGAIHRTPEPSVCLFETDTEELTRIRLDR